MIIWIYNPSMNPLSPFRFELHEEFFFPSLGGLFPIGYPAAVGDQTEFATTVIDRGV